MWVYYSDPAGWYNLVTGQMSETDPNTTPSSQYSSPPPAPSPTQAISAPAPAASSTASAGIGEIKKGGWRWGQTGQQIGGGGESGDAPSYAMNWLWDETLPESQGYWTTVYDEMGSQQQWVAPPGNPTGEYVEESVWDYGGEGSPMSRLQWVDSGSRIPHPDQNAYAMQRFDASLPNLSRYSIDQIFPMIERASPSIVKRLMETGKLSPDVTAELGPWLAARQAEEADRHGFMSHINDFIGTELTHLENIGESYQADPERALLGINTPLESKLWGGLLGKDYDPNINMYGSPTERDYREAAESGYDPSFDAWGHSAAEGIVGGMFGATLGAYPAMQTPQGIAALTAGRAGFAAINGGDSAGAKAALISALIAQGVNVASPYVAAAINDAIASGNGTPEEVMRLIQLADAGATTTDVSGPLMPPAVAEPPFAPLMPPAITDPNGVAPLMPPAVQDPVLTNPDIGMLPMPAAIPEAGDPTSPDDEAAQPTVTSEDVQKYAKIATAVYNLLGQEQGSAPEGAPERSEAEDDAHFTEELGTYLGLDPTAMAEQGLEPGSPEYMEFIMSRADQVIADVLGDMDVDAEDFAQQLRGKTEQELLGLQRALYVRGQMNQLMGSGTYEDPATGFSEEVVGSGTFNPGTAAFQRGIARNVGELAGSSDPRAYLNRWLGRDVDFYGMQGQADQRYQDALRNETDEDELRRRGMFSGQ